MVDAPVVLRQFLIYMETIKGKSKKTVAEYYLDLRIFFRFLKVHQNLVPKGAVFEEIAINDMDIERLNSVKLLDLYEFMNYLNTERNISARSRARKVSSLRTFYKYLSVNLKAIDDNPAKYLDYPKLKKSLPAHLTLEESISLLESVDGPNKQRDYAILTLFLNCGMRLSELAGINMSDFRSDTIIITGKGNKERTVYLNNACKIAIEDYLKTRPNEGSKDRRALFLSRNKNRISVKTIQWLVKKYLGAAGLDTEKYSTHKLRHTAATLMYQHGGVDIRTLQEILGHEQLSTTEIYTHINDERLRSAVYANPLSKIKK